MKTIYFAGGCFWGMEAFIKKASGCKGDGCGICKRTKANPTYEEVCSHTTGHAETVRVVYDPSQITLEMLLKAFFKVVDPTELNRQGGDVGEQYRNGIYYTDEEDRKTIEAAIRAVREKYDQPVVTECRKLVCFYDAEEYHQDYLDKIRLDIATLIYLMRRSLLRRRWEREQDVNASRALKGPVNGLVCMRNPFS